MVCQFFGPPCTYTCAVIPSSLIIIILVIMMTAIIIKLQTFKKHMCHRTLGSFKITKLTAFLRANIIHLLHIFARYLGLSTGTWASGYPFSNGYPGSKIGTRVGAVGPDSISGPPVIINTSR